MFLKWAKYVGIGLVTVAFLGLFVPSKTAIYTMAAVYYGKQMSQTVELTEKMKKVSEIIDLNLDEAIFELKGRTLDVQEYGN